MIFCKNCGKQSYDEANFCQACGTALNKTVLESVSNDDYTKSAQNNQSVRQKPFYYYDGQLKELRRYSNETHKSHGIWEYYYENGNLKVECNYKDGKKDGIYKEFYQDGKLQIERNYKDGILFN